jgi:hypothetical protein
MIASSIIHYSQSESLGIAHTAPGGGVCGCVSQSRSSVLPWEHHPHSIKTILRAQVTLAFDQCGGGHSQRRRRTVDYVARASR